MNTEPYQNTADQPEVIELSLRTLFWSIVRHYRSILIVMLVLGLALGGWQAYRQIRIKFSPEAEAKAEEAYQEELEAYNQKKEQLETRITNLNKEIDSQNSYKENALLLLIDPYNAYSHVVTYYLDSGYQIMPEMYYQNPNYTSAILNSYKLILDRIDFDKILRKNSDNENITKNNPVSGNSLTIVSTSVDTGNATLTIRVLADSESRENLLLKTYQDAIAENEVLLSDIIGEHSISILSEEEKVGVNSDLVSLHNSFNNNLSSLSDSLEAAKEELSELEEPVKDFPTKTTIIVAGIKYFIIGMVAGLFLMAVWYAIRFILRDRMESPSDISRRHQTNFLGYLPLTAGRKSGLFARFDRGVRKHLGLQSQLSEEMAERILVSNTKLYAPGTNDFLLMGTAPENKIHEVKKVLTDGIEGISLMTSRNLLTDADTIDSLTGSRNVILVEELATSRNKDVTEELKTIQAAGCAVTGIVLV